MGNTFHDATLLLVGHGSLFGPDSAAPIHAHADRIRETEAFRQVAVAFWKEEPYVWNCLHGLQTKRVFIVPFFISSGYFTDDVIPRELGIPEDKRGYGRGVAIEEQTLIYCEPVGTHAAMTEVILARANEVVSQHPFPSKPSEQATSLFVVGHGTGRNANSRTAVDEHVAKVAATNRFAEVQSVFMDEAPSVDQCWNLASKRNLVVVPFFISEGLHTQKDIPEMLGESPTRITKRMDAGQPTWQNPTERHGKRLWMSAPAGTHPMLGDIIMDRVNKASASTPV